MASPTDSTTPEAKQDKTPRFRLFGDLRLRLEIDRDRLDAPDRTRGRLRFRLEGQGDLGAGVTVGARIVTREDEEIDNPKSPFWDFGKILEKAGIALDRIYACESCHNNPKALGFGIAGGVFQTRYAEPIVEDLMDQRTGEIIPERYQVQIQSIPGLDFDWSTIVDSAGNQVQTVGTHWPLSRALSNDERTRLRRTGLCMGCHREMTNDELWNQFARPGRLTDAEHIELMNRLLREAGSTRTATSTAGGQ